MKYLIGNTWNCRIVELLQFVSTSVLQIGEIL